jgi:hypothetical protein
VDQLIIISVDFRLSNKSSPLLFTNGLFISIQPPHLFDQVITNELEVKSAKALAIWSECLGDALDFHSYFQGPPATASM